MPETEDLDELSVSGPLPAMHDAPSGEDADAPSAEDAEGPAGAVNESDDSEIADDSSKDEDSQGDELQDTDELDDTDELPDTDELHEPLEDTDEAEDSERSSISLASIVPLLLITGLLAFAVVLLFGRSSFDEEPALTQVDPADRPTLSPLEPEGDLEVTGPGIIETFKDGDSTGLGETDNGRNWGELTGQWDIEDGEARLVRAPEVRSIAAVDSGVINGTMLTTFVHARAGSGIVFRLVDSSNYWMLVAVPNSATWNLRKVVDGIATDVTNMGLASSDDGVTISVTFDGDQITLGLNGEERASVTDNTHQGATAIGLTAAGATAAEVAWDNVIVTPLLGARG